MEVCVAEVCVAEVCVAKVYVLEVCATEVCISKVGFNIKIRFSPLIPLLYSLFEFLQVFGVGHRV